MGLGFWLDQILESDEIIEISPNSPSFLSNCILIEILKKKSFNPPMIFLLHNTPRVCVCVCGMCVCVYSMYFPPHFSQDHFFCVSKFLKTNK